MSKNETDVVRELEGLTNLFNSNSGAELSGKIESVLSKALDSGILSKEAIEGNITGIKHNSWERLGKLISDGAVFSEEGYGLIIAPYKVWRPGTQDRMSVLFCRKKNFDYFPFNSEKLQRDNIFVNAQRIIPIDVLHSSGNIGGEKGETFIVPNGWRPIKNADDGAPYLDVSGSKRRLDDLGTDDVLARLFTGNIDPILDLKNDPESLSLARFWEYSLHEYGHSLGAFKDRMPTIIRGSMHQAALEEWRCDGVMCHLVDKHVQWGDISEHQGKNILMSNFLTRFGMDILRHDGSVDHDVVASYMIFKDFEETELLELDNDSFHLLGDLSTYSYWRDLYSLVAEQGMSTTDQIRREPTIAIPFECNEADIQNFVAFVSRVGKHGSEMEEHIRNEWS